MKTKKTKRDVSIYISKTNYNLLSELSKKSGKPISAICKHMLDNPATTDKLLEILLAWDNVREELEEQRNAKERTER